jgi:hypothetical protein
VRLYNCWYLMAIMANGCVAWLVHAALEYHSECGSASVGVCVCVCGCSAVHRCGTPRRFCSCATEAHHTAGLACSYMEQEALYNAFHLLDTTDCGTIQSSDLATIFGNSLKPSEIEGIMKEAKTRSAFLAVFVVRMQSVCFQARARDTCD